MRSTQRHLVVAALCLVMVAGCAGPQREAEPVGVGAAPAGVEAIPSIVREVQPSVVAVLTDVGEGSGVILDPDGVIVTNNHVVAGSQGARVALVTGERLDAEVVATDPLSDLAVLRVDRDNLPAAELAEELPEVGELAIAIGNPLGLENTVTAGIISAVNRSVPAGAGTPPALTDLIQTDAPISPGNSGGALVDGDGRLVGVNVAYLPPAQTGAVSIGFAIPAPTVTDVVAELLDDGQVEHAFLGIQPAPITRQIAEQLGLGSDEGVAALTVVDGSPAADAGVEPGDVVVALDDAPVREVGDLLGLLRQRDPGDRVTLTVLRRGDQREVDVELEERPRSAAVPPAP